MNQAPRKSYIRNLTVWVFLLATVPMLLLGLFSVITINHRNRTALSVRLDESLQSLDRILQDDLGSRFSQLGQVAASPQMQQVLTDPQPDADVQEDLRRTLFNILGAKSAQATIHFVRADGQIKLSTTSFPEIYDVTRYHNWGIYRSAESQQGPYLYAGITQPKDSGQAAISLVYPLVGEDVAKGWLIMDLSSDYLKNLSDPIRSTTYGMVRFLIVNDHDFLIYNGTDYQSDVRFLSNFLTGAKRILDHEPLDQKKWMIRTYTSSRYPIHYLGMINDAYLDDSAQAILLVMAALLIPSALISGLIGYLMSRRFTRPILALSQVMQAMTPDNLEARVVVNRQDEIGLIETRFNDLMSRIRRYHEEDIRKQELLRQSQIRVLQGQINPHFLNNTLDTIKWEAKLNGMGSLSKMVTELAVLLKGSMDSATTFVSVAEEIRFVKSYLFIQQQRYGERFRFTISIEPTMLSEQIPKLILQPLVENAIVHGIESLSSHGTIEIYGWIHEDDLYFSVADNGLGADFDLNEWLAGPEPFQAQQIGLRNVHRRLRLYYGETYGVRYRERPEGGALFLLRLPRNSRKQGKETLDVSGHDR